MIAKRDMWAGGRGSGLGKKLRSTTPEMKMTQKIHEAARHYYKLTQFRPNLLVICPNAYDALRDELDAQIDKSPARYALERYNFMEMFVAISSDIPFEFCCSYIQEDALRSKWKEITEGAARG